MFCVNKHLLTNQLRKNQDSDNAIYKVIEVTYFVAMCIAHQIYLILNQITTSTIYKLMIT